MPLADDGRPLESVDGARAPERDAGGAFLVAALAALVVARLPVLVVRAFDNDEFEHAHAAWNVSRGLLPYKDFFEHHTPWHYFALSPLFRWFAADRSFDAARHFLISARLVSLALTMLAAVLVFLVGRLGATRRTGLIACLLFLAQPVLIHKTLEIRPDVPALTFFVGALWSLRRALLAPQRPTLARLGWFLCGGLCLGGAVMCTQKLLFALPGVFLGLGLWVLGGGRRAWASRAAAILVVLAGVALPALCTWLWFTAHGGGRQFVYDNFLLNARWRWRTGRHVLVLLRSSWPVFLLGLVGAGEALFGRRAGRRDDGDVLLLCALLGLVAGAFVVPAAYEQYYLPPLTIACLFAARGLSLLLERSRHRERSWLVVAAILPLLIWPALDVRSALDRRSDVEMARLRFVFAHTSPDQPVLDGWLGTNVFRPAPLYYNFMHRELLVSMTDGERDAYLDALTTGRARPALIAMDDELRALGPRFLAFVRDHYVSDDGVFYLPARSRN
ncbi:MAG TPA: glycosyltransferase family 39 protein [Polyangia bacterium]|nr:glycosyltransferase family 39 protein [Polyangia bacterium]